YRIRHLESTYIIHHLDLKKRSFNDKNMEESSMFFAMMCHSFLYQSNLHNKIMFYLEIFKRLVGNPYLTIKAFREEGSRSLRQVSK
ncbi:MAG: hypothetical protein ACKPB9_24850, partial [Dolichospermum sp.]